jgi:hypothetical protein
MALVALAGERCAAVGTASSRNASTLTNRNAGSRDTLGDRILSRAAMNKKQKVLTVIALIAFVVIGVLGYIKHPLSGGDWVRLGLRPPLVPYIKDVRMPWFMLGVIYGGLFFVLGDKKDKR